MFNQSFFAEHLLLLRTTHNLSNADLANLIGLKNRTTINSLEKEKTLPSITVFSDIADLFCVSTDWLRGNSNKIYNNDIMLLLEENYLEELFDEEVYIMEKYKRHRLPFTFIIECPLYSNQKTRIENFSLPLRANILFMFFWFRYIERKTDDLENPFLALKNGFSNFKNAFIESITFTNKKHKKIYDQGHYYIDLLEKILISKKISTPVFDITNHQK